MSSIELYQHRLRRLRYPWLVFTRWIASKMPKGLYGRSLIIIITPMVLLQSVVAFVFMERHWQSVTQRLSAAVVRDVSAIVSVIETYPQDTEYETITRISREKFALNISILPPDPLPPPNPKPFFSILDGTLSQQITHQIGKPFWIDTVGDSNLLEIRIRLEKNVLRVFVRRSRAYASNTQIFLLWMSGTSIVLIFISILFLRNQIRPIQKLAEAAETFGKGRSTPGDFKPRGAQEVRRAGIAFLEMRGRIERQIEQRTTMLAGVSHDLRTILTRFKLQLALLGKSQEVDELQNDVDDMQKMIEGYVNFTRGEGDEEPSTVNLAEVLSRLENEAKLSNKELTHELRGRATIHVRPGAFSRLLNNLVSNAIKNAAKIHIVADHRGSWLSIHIDDNGAGIPEEFREEVFKPFYRLDEARNQDDSGTGLGLAIARDIARAHGGDITLHESKLGGLRATIRIPA